MTGNMEIKIEGSISKQALVNYVASYFQNWIEEKEEFGADDRIVKDDMKKLIAMRVMAENLIGVPINLGLDGKITIGF